MVAIAQTVIVCPGLDTEQCLVEKEKKRFKMTIVPILIMDDDKHKCKL